MQRTLTIRNVLAGFFLLLFAFCITPKRTLHNLVASHKDGRFNSKLQGPYQTQINKAGFQCQVDNLITESPFVTDTYSPFTFIASAFFSYQEKQAPFIDSAEFFCSGLRGPPAC